MDESLQKLFSEIDNLLKQSKVEKFLEEWMSIQGIQNNPQFSVAVVGEFSRGKSTLLNRLLGQDILPVGTLPTTAMITYIRYGKEQAIYRVLEQGQQEKITLEELQNLVAQDSGEDPKGCILIELPYEWLKEKQVEFLDTPGAGDLQEKRAMLTQRAIAECDATLVAISAALPLSLTEKSFVEEHIFQRKIPRVACILTRLDQIKESERETLVKSLLNRLHSWNPEIELWSSFGSPVLPESSSLKMAGTEAILEGITKWAKDPEHKKLRENQMLTQAHFLMKKLYYHLLGKKAQIMGEIDGDKAKAEQESEKQSSGLEIAWKDITISMEQRELEAENEIKECFQDKAKEICDRLCESLENASSPQEWQQKKMHLLVIRYTREMIQNAENCLQKKIQDDILWLKNELEEFSEKISTDGYKGLIPKEILSDVPCLEEQGQEMDLRKIGIGVATGIATGMAFPVLGSVLIPSTIVAGTIAAYKSMQIKEEKKQKIEAEIGRVIESNTRKMQEKSQKKIREYYKKTIEKIQKRQKKYLDIQHEAIVAQYAPEEKNLESVQAQEREAKSLVSRIENYLKQNIEQETKGENHA